MNFVSIRLITADTKRLVAFYAEATGVQPTWHTNDFAEIVTPSGTLAIAHARTLRLFGEGIARPADNHSVIIELHVNDVDAEYAKLAPRLEQTVQAPKTMPWGNRSLLFRDPDGNLVNYFTPVSEEAKRRFEQQVPHATK